MEASDRDAGLAPAYVLALELESEGLDEDVLAERLGVPVEGVRTLLAVAHAKARRRNA
jgi:hypothetical protein